MTISIGSPLIPLFVGTGFLSISAIALGLLISIVSTYGIMFAINLGENLYGYLLDKIKYKNKGISINSKLTKVLIASFIAFIIFFSIGLFQVISSGINLSDEIPPKLNEVLNSIDNKYSHYINNKVDINFEKTTSIVGIDEVNLSSIISNINVKFIDSTD